MQAVILAAGKGTRLGSLTRSKSKAMQPVLGKPMFLRVMESLLPHGIDDFILVVNPADVDIQEYCEHHLYQRYNLQITCQKEQLGAAHALAQARPFIRDRFILSACDNLIPQKELAPFFDTWRANNSLDGLLALQVVPKKRIPYTAIVELRGSRVTRIIEKPSIESAPSNTASLPFYGFSKRILPHLDNLILSPRGEYEIQEAIQKLIDVGGVIQGIFVGDRLTLSKPSDLLEINRHFLQESSPPVRIIGTHSIGPDTVFIAPVYVEPGTNIGAGCRIGPEVYIEDGCMISDGCKISGVVLLRGSKISPGSALKNQVVSPHISHL